jgi:nitroimidazol reductase NimA-like FMN-containing flavoprotein (pyridoxamine 5'-phosphate oxidase superfamily)
MSTSAHQLNQSPTAIAFLSQPLIARIATCNPGTFQPHVVPVWYEWDGQAVWISSFRTTRKIREIRKNPRISLVVDIAQTGDANQGVIFEGKAELISDPDVGVQRGTSIYSRYLGLKGAQADEPQSWLHDPDHLLIRLVPDWIHFWGM